eukprot:2766211-Pleurochrysis_carterae.AAC.2
MQLSLSLDNVSNFLRCLTENALNKAVYNSLVLDSHVGPLHNEAAQSPWRRPMQRVLMRVGPFSDKVREVCKEVFTEHYPCSLASLKRRIQEVRIHGCEPGKFGTNRRDESKVSFRTTKSLLARYLLVALVR